jgi:predicted polyphosphate/ATP-dependent NAD kinase
MEEKKIDIKVDEQVALGQYSNLAAIRHTRDEFIFDFAFIFPDGPMGKLVARIILSPAHVKRFQEALDANTKRYEENFGPITPAETPPAVGFVH